MDHEADYNYLGHNYVLQLDVVKMHVPQQMAASCMRSLHCFFNTILILV